MTTPITTLRFIGFVAKISVLNPKPPADGQWPKETKESVTFIIYSPLIDRTNKEQSSFCITPPPFALIDFFFFFYGIFDFSFNRLINFNLIEKLLIDYFIEKTN